MDWDKIVRQRVKYDPDTGKLLHRKKVEQEVGEKWAYWWNREFAEKEITNKDKDGYIKVEINVSGKRKNFVGHRLAWFLYYGFWPTSYLDHINGIRSDNRIVNLREITHKENRSNNLPYTKGTSDGIYYNNKAKKWVVYEYVTYGGKGRKRHLGYYDTYEKAEESLWSRYGAEHLLY